MSLWNSSIRKRLEIQASAHEENIESTCSTKCICIKSNFVGGSFYSTENVGDTLLLPKAPDFWVCPIFTGPWSTSEVNLTLLVLCSYHTTRHTEWLQQSLTGYDKCHSLVINGMNMCMWEYVHVCIHTCICVDVGWVCLRVWYVGCMSVSVCVRVCVWCACAGVSVFVCECGMIVYLHVYIMCVNDIHVHVCVCMYMYGCVPVCMHMYRCMWGRGRMFRRKNYITYSHHQSY